MEYLKRGCKIYGGMAEKLKNLWKIKKKVTRKPKNAFLSHGKPEKVQISTETRKHFFKSCGKRKSLLKSCRKAERSQKAMRMRKPENQTKKATESRKIQHIPAEKRKGTPFFQFCQLRLFPFYDKSTTPGMI